MRQLPTVLLLLAIVAAAGWTLLRWERPASQTTDPWHAIPLQAAMVLEVPDGWTTWDHFTHTTQLWSAFEQVPGAAAMGRIMARTMARMENDAALRQALDGTPVLVALLRSSGGGIGCLFVAASGSSTAIPMMAFGELLAADAATTQALAAGGVVQLRPDTALSPLTLCIRNGLWLLASSPEVMDEALMQLDGGTPISKDPILAQALSTRGAGSDAHLLVHSTRAQRLLNRWWNAAHLDDMDLPEGWAALDLRARPDALLMSGLLVPAKDHPLLNAMLHQGLGRNTLTRVLPATVNALSVQHIADAARWPTDRRPGSADSTLAAPLFSWVEGAMGIATASTTSGTLKWALFSTDDSDLAAEALWSTCPDGCDTLAYRGTRLTRLPYGSMHERLLGPAYAFLDRPWWTALGDVVLFSSDVRALQASIDAWNDGGALAEDRRSTNWAERLSEKSGLAHWCDVARSRPLLNAGMKPDELARFNALDSLWLRLGGASLQLSPGQRGTYHLVIGLQHAPLEVTEDGIVWSTAVGAAVSRKPDILRNHLNNTLEVLVQDVQHRIHLLGSNGKLLWSRSLDGPIMGAVAQVDRFRNGKLQLLFNTAERIHLVDRNGKDVGGFPLVLKSAATAPLAVFDYENERDYRVLVPTADGRLNNYALDGTPVKGWESPTLAGTVRNAVEHIRIKSKDYLLVIGGQGQVKLLDRRGAERESSALQLGHDAVLRRVLPGMDIQGTKLVWCDANGALHQGSLAGEQHMLAAQGTAWQADLGNDGILEIIRITGDSLMVTQEGRPLFARSFQADLLPELHLYELGRDRTAIGVVQPAADLVTLVDGDGREVVGLPVPGMLPCNIADLDLDGSPELISVTADGTVHVHRAPGLRTQTP